MRAAPFAAQCEAGNVKLLSAPWNEAFLAELEHFPSGGHDDQVDAASGAFALLTQAAVKGWALLELARRELAQTKERAPQPPKPAYAPGSVEWERAQSSIDDV